jgi:uncharacterized protein YkwD
MVHQARRRRIRTAGLLLCGVIVVGLVLAEAAPLPGPYGPPRARAAEQVRSATPRSALDSSSQPIYDALNQARGRANLPRLDLDESLIATAQRDACAIARGEVPLSSDKGRLAEAGAERENVGLVIEDDPVTGAHTMQKWWTDSVEHRRDRMDADMRRYGVASCTLQDRTYFVERFAS